MYTLNFNACQEVESLKSQVDSMKERVIRAQQEREEAESEFKFNEVSLSEEIMILKEDLLKKASHVNKLEDMQMSLKNTLETLKSDVT